ncbi:MAG: LysR family transcriptional regulator [Solirubrobacterales bacterium]
MLSTSRLQVLREVIDHGSFSAAADALSYSQSAVSQAIATLEGEAGASLIERTRSGALPTAAGATLMPGAVTAFRASHPGVELTLAEGEPEEIAPRLRGGEFDLVLLFEFPGSGERLGAGLRRFDLLDDPLHLALPHDHRLAGRSRLRLEDLAEDSWVQTSAASPCAKHVVRSCHQTGFDPRVSFESDDYQTVQGLVAAGVGVALIPQLALSTVRPDVLVRPLDPQPPLRKVFAATPRSAAATPAVATMLDVLREAGRRAAEAAA